MEDEVNVKSSALYKVISTVLLLTCIIIVDISSSLVGVISFILFLYVDTLIHELGHVLLGKLVKFKDYMVSFGGGKERFRIKVFDVIFVIKSGSGAMTAVSRFGEKHMRFRLFLFSLGGILFNFAAASLMYLLNGFNFELDKINIPLVFVVSNLYFIVINLIPFNFYMDGVKTPNDGLRLLKIPFFNEDELLEIRFYDELSFAYGLLENNEYASALIKYEYLLKKFPQHEKSIAINYSVCLTNSIRLEEAKDILLKQINSDNGTHRDSLIKNNIAWICLLEGSDALICADKYSEEALLADPNNFDFNNTRGCVLIESGRIDEGIEILKKLINISDPMQNHKYNPMNYLFIAYGYFLKGELGEAEKYLNPVKSYLNVLEPDDLFLLNRLKQKNNTFANILEDTFATFC